MKKLIKMISITVTIVIGYSLFKFLKKLSEYSSLTKSLGEYLFDITGQKPVINTHFTTMKLFIEVGYPESLINSEKNLEQCIENYINDYYPLLANHKKQIKIYSIDF